MAATISEESLDKALEFAIGCPVNLNMILGEPLAMEQIKDHVKTTIHLLYSEQQNTNTNTVVTGETLLLASHKIKILLKLLTIR